MNAASVLLAESGNRLAGQITLTIVFVVVPLIAYWVPSFIAYRRHLPARVQVALVNGFLGWTVIGWIVALVWAFQPVPRPATR